jgi:hypothetical protein
VAEMEQLARKRNRSAWIAAGVFAAAVVMIVVAAAPLVVSIFSAATSGRVDVPGTTVRHLGAGEYLVMPHTASTIQYGPVGITRGDGSSIRSVQIVGPDAVAVALEPDSGTSFDLNGDHYESAARFRVEQAGDYSISSQSDRSTTMLVIRDPFDGIATRIAVAAAGGLVALVAGVWWIVALVRGSRRRHAGQQLPPPPASPGWPSDLTGS